MRREITRRPEIKKGFQFREEDGDGSYRNYAWSKMLARVFKIDVETCECGGKLVNVCAVNDRDSIRRYLKSQSLDPDPPARASARYRQQELEYEDNIYVDDLPVIDLA